MHKRFWLWLSNITLMVNVACGQYKNYDAMLSDMYRNTVPVIYPDSLNQWIQNGKPVVILDARESNEFSVSHIIGAKNVGYDNFRMKELKSIPKDSKIVVYCSVGYRSERIGEKLKEEGYSDVSNLYGGIFKWKNEGLPVYHQNNETDSVHAYSEKWGVWLQKGVKVYD